MIGEKEPKIVYEKVVVKRDMVAKALSLGAVGLAILGFAGSALLYKYQRETSPVGSEEFSAYFSSQNQRLSRLEAENTRLLEEVQKLRVGECLLAEQIMQSKIDCAKFMELVDSNYQRTRSLTPALGSPPVLGK